MILAAFKLYFYIGAVIIFYELITMDKDVFKEIGELFKGASLIQKIAVAVFTIPIALMLWPIKLLNAINNLFR